MTGLSTERPHHGQEMAQRRSPPSMHRSLQKAFWTFGGVLVLAYAFLHTQMSNWQEDQLLWSQISLEFESYLVRHPEALSGSSPPPMTSRFFSVHLGEGSLPEALRPEALRLPPGIHEINRSPTEGEDFFLAIRETAEPGKRLYLVYDVRRFENYEWWHSRIPALLFACAVVSSIGLVWASRYSRSVLEPLTGLAETVGRESDPASLAEALSRRDDPAELAELGRALEGSMKTIGELVRREKEFTRNASHELRTPLAVILSAVELLEYEDLSAAANRRLLRIQRSARQMEELIETFLWLAREHPKATEERVEVVPLVQHIVESHRHLLGSRPVEVVLDMDPDLEIAAHEPILAVVLANLVKNGFYSTQEGSVTISCTSDALSVTDSGPGLGSVGPVDPIDPIDPIESDPERSTHGFGLTIVRDLCRLSHWQLELRDVEPRGARAIVRFADPPSS